MKYKEVVKMGQHIKVGVIGDYDPDMPNHIATDEALVHAADALSVSLTSSWIPTESLAKGTVENSLKPFHALWCAPGSPYQSMEGALNGIQFAREMGWPFLGTWGGFQHALVEYARNVLGIRDADHEESAPDAPTLLISKLNRPLVCKTQSIKTVPGSLVQQAYEQDEVVEKFVCSYGLNPELRHKFEKSQLEFTGIDPDGEVRIAEIAGHPFFVATLFQPQLSSTPENPHPLIVAFLKAALAFQRSG
jgi:CTP synthase (UTP-ammonia lyase)